MNKCICRASLFFAIAFLLSGTAATAYARGVPVARFLNSDGTLKLDGQFSGTLDLNGYGVHMDPGRGPVFGPMQGDSNAPMATTLGNWSAIGDGGGALSATVYAIGVSGTDVYVGGAFSNVANIPEADYIAKWDGTNWSALGSNGAGDGALNSFVRSIAVSGSSIYVGGNFTDVNNGGTVLGSADYVAKWDGTNWSSLGSNGAGNGALNGAVLALAVSGSSLYLGGQFTNVNNAGTILGAADYVAQWDGTNWSALGSNGAGNGSLNGMVVAVAASGTNVYVGGWFENVNNNGTALPAADRVAKWDGTNWSALGNNGAGNGALQGRVDTLAIDAGGAVYVGGNFTNVQNGSTTLYAADYIAKWDGTNWSALGDNGSSDGALNGDVQVIIVDGTNLYVGGYFTDASNGATVLNRADYVAKWDGSNWSGLGNNGAGNGAIPNHSDPWVHALALAGSNLLIGGWFTDVSDGGAPLLQADFIAEWDGTHWHQLGTSPNGSLVQGPASASVNAIAVIGTDVYVGGSFEDVSNHGVNIPEADYIAKWDGTSWSALGSNGAGDGALDREVYALAVIGTNLYVGGEFVNVHNGGTVLDAADYIAKWDGSNWSALGDNSAGDGALNNTVNALAASGTDLFVGGWFTDAANVPAADYVAKWNGTSWSALGSNGAGDGALDNGVAAIALSGTDLYAGGWFTNAANNPAADFLAKWDGANWSALGSDGSGNGTLHNDVYAIAASGPDLYVGGYINNLYNGSTHVNGSSYIAKWDGTNWSALGGDGLGGPALNDAVMSIIVNGSDVYAAGYFTNVNNNGIVLTAADYVARWNGSSWSALGTPGQVVGSLNNIGQALEVNGTDLLVGGTFTDVKNMGATPIPEADYLAAYGMPADVVPPAVLSINRKDASPTVASTVRFVVTFAENVTGVDMSDLHLVATGVSGASITGVSGANGVYVVTVNTGTGNGTLGLNLVDDDSIRDMSGNKLGGSGAGNGNLAGQAYTVNKVTPPANTNSSIFLPMIRR